MAIGDINMDPDGVYGTEEIPCDECAGLIGADDPECKCGGTRVMLRLIAPDNEIRAALENVTSQIKQIQRPN